MDELQQISELTLEVTAESPITTTIDEISGVTPYYDIASGVTTRLTFTSKLP